MSNTLRITKLSMVLTLAAGLGACDDLPQPPHKVTTPIAAQPARPSETPPPAATTMPTPAPTPTTDNETKVHPTVAVKDDDGDDDDQKIDPSQALAGARKLLANGKAEGALRLAKVAVLRTPKRSGAWNVLGRAQLVVGKREDAIESFEKAVELNPESSYARNNLGLALIYDKRFEQAVDSLEQAVELEPVEAYMWNNLGMAYEQLDRLEDARDAYDKAVAMDSERASASLSRLKGVKSVIQTAKVDLPLKVEKAVPADDETKNGVAGKTAEIGKTEPSTMP